MLTGAILACRCYLGRLASRRSAVHLAVARGDVLVVAPCEGEGQRPLQPAKLLDTHIRDSRGQQSTLHPSRRPREEVRRYRRRKVLQRKPPSARRGRKNARRIKHAPEKQLGESVQASPLAILVVDDDPPGGKQRNLSVGKQPCVASGQFWQTKPLRLKERLTGWSGGHPHVEGEVDGATAA